MHILCHLFSEDQRGEVGGNHNIKQKGDYTKVLRMQKMVSYRCRDDVKILHFDLNAFVENRFFLTAALVSLTLPIHLHSYSLLVLTPPY